MKKIEDYEHQYTQDIVCPYCGAATDDTDNRCDDNMEGKEICEECGNEYSFEADIEVTWITAKLNPLPDAPQADKDK